VILRKSLVVWCTCEPTFCRTFCRNPDPSVRGSQELSITFFVVQLPLFPIRACFRLPPTSTRMIEGRCPPSCVVSLRVYPETCIPWPNAFVLFFLRQKRPATWNRLATKPSRPRRRRRRQHRRKLDDFLLY